MSTPSDALAAIRAEGADLELPSPAQAGEAQAPAALDPASDPGFIAEAREWAEFPALFGGIIAQAMPEVAPAYSEENCLEWGKRMVPVARKYGWSTAAFGGWVGLAGATWVFAKPTMDAVKARRAAPARSPAKVPDAAKSQEAKAPEADSAERVLVHAA